MFMIVYLYSVNTLFKLASTPWQFFIALVAHPIIVEIVTTMMKMGQGQGKANWGTELPEHPFYQHESSFTVETILNLFRRFLFNETNSVQTTTVLVILCGIQEVLVRSSMVFIIIFFLFHYPLLQLKKD